MINVNILVNRSFKQILQLKDISYVFGNRVKLTTACLSKEFAYLNKTNSKLYPTKPTNISPSIKLKESSNLCSGYQSYHHESSHDILHKHYNVKEKLLKRAFYSSSIKKEINSKNSGSENNTALPSEQKHENIFTIPNLLCMSRIILSPYLAHVIINNGDFSLALGIFMYAGATDAVSNK